MPLHVSSTCAYRQEVKIVLYSLFMPLHVSSTCVHRQEVKIVLYSLWYHHTYKCDDTRSCRVQFRPPDDGHVCSKHVKA